MDIASLNEAQRSAVTATEGAVLVMAGAGSGKTRVLTMRAAYLIEQGVPPYALLALTFTNKAAAEMTSRIDLLTGSAPGMWTGTFHSVCARMLRRDADKLGYTGSFTIYDESDAVALIRDLIRDAGADPKLLAPKQVKYAISTAKNGCVAPADYADDNPDNPNSPLIADIYAKYLKRMRDNNAMDFDDLLLCTLELFKTQPEVLTYYANRFQYVMVDEYQDTNMVQYQLVRSLSSVHKNVFVVGDDDQSIYGWRGADIRNILEFERDFPNAQVFYLEQNYRSHQGILDIANEVIANNPHRKVKRLFTDQKAGVRPCDYCAANEFAEAEYIAAECARLRSEGTGYEQMAVLYRVNAQSRVLEEEMKRRGIPYRIYGGTGFYERKEIKDVVAYLNLIVNPSADISLMRVINEPKRAIGATTVTAIHDFADANGMSMTMAAGEAGSYLPGRATNAVAGFLALMDDLRRDAQQLSLVELIDAVLNKTGYIKALNDEKTAEANNRIVNLEEFQNAASEYMQSFPDATLGGFLERNSLVSDVDTIGDETGVVSLMTMHAAKGLEFDAVFIAGMENELLPHSMSMADGVEEERRLCYVAITRAKRRLYLCHAKLRRIRVGGDFIPVPRVRSDFLAEIPESMLSVSGDRSAPLSAKRENADSAKTAHPFESFAKYRQARQNQPQLTERDTSGFEAGVRVFHDKFGDGTISAVSGSGKEAVAAIKFDDAGEKKMFLAFAPLKLL